MQSHPQQTTFLSIGTPLLPSSVLEPGHVPGCFPLGLCLWPQKIALVCGGRRACLSPAPLSNAPTDSESGLHSPCELAFSSWWRELLSRLTSTQDWTITKDVWAYRGSSLAEYWCLRIAWTHGKTSSWTPLSLFAHLDNDPQKRDTVCTHV